MAYEAWRRSNGSDHYVVTRRTLKRRLIRVAKIVGGLVVLAFCGVLYLFARALEVMEENE